MHEGKRLLQSCTVSMHTLVTPALRVQDVFLQQAINQKTLPPCAFRQMTDTTDAGTLHERHRPCMAASKLLR